VTEAQIKNERARQERDRQRMRANLTRLEAEANAELRKLDTWAMREIVKQRLWDDE